MNVNIRVSVRVGDFFVVYFGQPVVGGYRAAVGKNKSADRISNGGVFFNTPVGYFYVIVYYLFVVEQRFVYVSDVLPLFTI